MPAIIKIFGDNPVLQLDGGTLELLWRNAPGNHVALEACVQNYYQSLQIKVEEKTRIFSDQFTHSRV